MPSEYAIRRMTMADVAGVTAVEAAVFPNPWNQEAFISEMKNVAARYLVAEQAGRIIGYAGAWLALDEGDIIKIAVLAEHRGQGIGRALLAELMQYLANLGCAVVTLEVRRSNEVAQNLYKGQGFIRLGVRKRYYDDGEDAFIMACDHMPEINPDFEEPETVHE